MATVQPVGPGFHASHGTLRAARPAPSFPAPTAHPLTTLYVSLAALGVAALSGAGASSLIAGLAGGTAPAPWLQWISIIATSAWSVAALLYAFAALRTTKLLWAAVAQKTVAVAAALHLGALLLGMWRLPETTRSFDLTLAGLLLLELSVLAVAGWQRTSDARARSNARTHHAPSALALVATLFAASILVAAVATVGMASSAAGSLAVPHSGHGESQHNPQLPSNVQQLKNSEHHH
ncbi:hypothetical protein [Arthrobacter sp. GMC3]|uniref:hypothetical protein n=1 Tax=Arthrobacter sp. GMC3 TaxID=2058894 RepID=UPI000CE44C66|nr:hypothetical protein [Arthrobacter sp. GMC3]